MSSDLVVLVRHQIPEAICKAKLSRCAMAQDAQVRAVLQEWQASKDVVGLGVRGIMSRVEGKGEITRQDVCLNAEVICPIVKHFGALFVFRDSLWGRVRS